MLKQQPEWASLLKQERELLAECERQLGGEREKESASE
jgi:hypothetical protein